MKFGVYQVTVKAVSPGGEKYVMETHASEEMIDGSGMDVFAGEVDRVVVKALTEAYDDYEFSNRNYSATRSLQREIIWEKVKNINTDEELEEIRELLQIRD